MNCIECGDLQSSGLDQTLQGLRTVEVDVLMNGNAAFCYAGLKLTESWRVYILWHFEEEIASWLNEGGNMTNHPKRVAYMLEYMRELYIAI